MMRIAESQARLLFGKKPAGTRPARVQKRKEDLPENLVEAQVLDFLRLRNWTVTRNHVGTFVPYYLFVTKDKGAGRPQGTRVIKMGEGGMCDWHAVRPVLKPRTVDDIAADRPIRDSMVQMFDLEIKAPGETPKPHQFDWMRKRNAVGFTAVWFDGLDAGNSPLIPWYKRHFGER
jgi:hypothetical protein